MRTTIILLIILSISHSICFAYSDYKVEYMWYDGKLYEDNLKDVRNKCSEHYNKTGEVLNYPATMDDNNIFGCESYLYTIDDAKSMGFQFCIYGIAPKDYSKVILNTSRAFLDSNALYTKGFNFSQINSKLMESIEYKPAYKDEIGYNIMEPDSNTWYNFLKDDLYKYYIDSDIVKLLEPSNMQNFINKNGINAEVLDVFLIYSMEDWHYTLDNAPFIAVITDGGNYYITDLFENRADIELLSEHISQVKNEHSQMKIYNYNEAIKTLCTKKGTVSINDTDYSNIVNAEFDNKTVTVPLRKFAESLGYEVKWDSQNRTANLNSYNSKIIVHDEYWGYGYSVNVVDGERVIPLVKNKINTNNAYMYKGTLYITNEAIIEIAKAKGYDIDIYVDNCTITIKNAKGMY